MIPKTLLFAVVALTLAGCRNWRASGRPQRTRVSSGSCVLLEADAGADGDDLRAGIVRVAPPQREIARPARADLGVIPRVARGREEVLPAQVETEPPHPETRAEPLRHVPLNRDVLKADERAVLDPARGQAVERRDVERGHRVGGVGRRPVVQHRREHVARATGRFHPRPAHVDHLEVEGPAHQDAEGESPVGYGAREAEQIARLGITEDGLVVAVDLSVAVQVSQLVASGYRTRLATGGGLGRALKDPVPDIAVEIAERLTHLHDHVVLPPWE